MIKVDKNVLKRIVDGDERTFTKLYFSFANVVAFYINKFVKEIEESEFLTCELFAELPKLIESSYDENKSSFSTWLYRLARNKALSSLRRKEKYVTVPLEEAMIGAYHAFYIEYDAFQFEEVKKFLTDDEYFIIEALFVYDFTTKEIAQLLNISERKSRYLRHCILMKVRKYYRDNYMD